eukprot:SAG31_NODE_2812_length_5052_cov_2.155663_5_plen_65_part_00
MTSIDSDVPVELSPIEQSHATAFRHETQKFSYTALPPELRTQVQCLVSTVLIPESTGTFRTVGE